ncbi:MAG: ribonucleoside-triphosphate reductase, adenosylcobalamin-dependent [Cyanobacteria bacterium P01_F01_bin.153]
MVRELDRPQYQEFPVAAPTSYPVFYRTYSRRVNGQRETWQQVGDRVIRGLKKLGKLNGEECNLLRRMHKNIQSLPSGRWLWVGGTEWLEKPSNFSGAYNCTSTNVTDWRAFGLMMDLAMMGCGTGAVLEPSHVEQLPAVRNTLTVAVEGTQGEVPAGERQEETSVAIAGNDVTIVVGDSRQGWVKSYQTVLELSSAEQFDDTVNITINIRHIRPTGEVLKGFGGVANPIKVPDMYHKLVRILNKAVGRQLTSVECCLLIDQAAVVVVAGNVRRSAGMRQFSSEDVAGATAKDNLWQQDDNGNWRIDPERDALRMANHTRVFHRKPTLEECTDAVRKQFYSGEGAIQWAGEAIARASADLVTPELKHEFIEAYEAGNGREWLKNQDSSQSDRVLDHRLGRYGLNPCGEIIGEDFHCNLAEIHLNQLVPEDLQAQEDAFRAGGLAVASLLHHEFQEERYRFSREIDPIVGVSFTGLFDFFVKAFGVDWLKWWEAGRPDTVVGLTFKQKEAEFLTRWRNTVNETVWDYCDRHNLTRPNRCTTVQPAGTKSLLTGSSPGWHPPKAARFIRRITFRKNDPVARACMDYGYKVVPSQADKDDQGNLLNDPFDPRCSEWLVEIPVSVSWADLPGADSIAIEKFSALAQFDFYMQVQTCYTAHNTSATIELREEEVEPLAQRIHQAVQNDEGYMSAALLARFDAPFPRLPFEKIDRSTYGQLVKEMLERRTVDNFNVALARYDSGQQQEEGPAGCDSDKCLMPETK